MQVGLNVYIAVPGLSLSGIWVPRPHRNPYTNDRDQLTKFNMSHKCLKTRKKTNLCSSFCSFPAGSGSADLEPGFF